MRGLTKGLLGLVGAFALVGVIVWAWPLVIPPAPPPPASATPGTTAATGAATSKSGVVAETGPVLISILTTDTKAEWLGAVTQDFNAARKVTAAGRPIQVEMLQVSGPEEMMQSVLEGSDAQAGALEPGRCQLDRSGQSASEG